MKDSWSSLSKVPTSMSMSKTSQHYLYTCYKDTWHCINQTWWKKNQQRGNQGLNKSCLRAEIKSSRAILKKQMHTKHIILSIQVWRSSQHQFVILSLSGIIEADGAFYWFFSLLSSSAPQFRTLFCCTPAYFHWTYELLQNLQGNLGLDHKAVTGENNRNMSY